MPPSQPSSAIGIAGEEGPAPSQHFIVSVPSGARGRGGVGAKPIIGLSLIVAVVLLITGIRPLVNAEWQWQAIRQRGTLRIGIDPGWQPFSFYDAQGWQGYDAQLAQALGQRLHLAVQSDPVGYDAMTDALLTDRVDIGLSALTPDPSRSEDLLYTQPYFDAGPRLLTRQAVAGFEALAGQHVAVMLGGDADKLLRYWVRRVPGLQAVPLNSDTEVWAAYTDKRVDAALVDVLALPPAVAIPGYILSPQPRPYVIVVRKGNTVVLRELNRVLSAMQADGTLAEILGK